MHLRESFVLHEIRLTNVLASFILVIILNTLAIIFLVLLETHIFLDKSSTALHLLLHLYRLIMNAY